MHLEHVNLTVRDLDRSIAFYRDLLDLRVRWKGPIDADRLGALEADYEPGRRIYFLDPDGHEVELVEY